MKEDWEERCRNTQIPKRRLPLIEQECYPVMAEPMFDVLKLREAYEYFTHYRTKFVHLDTFFWYLCRLEKDVPLSKQKTQPDSI